MRVWRLCRKGHAAFDGEGARRYGGRWNPPGTAVVYTAATLSLAVLELFVRLEAEDRPDDLVTIAADIPNTLRVHALEVADLPEGWRSIPAPEELRSLGAAWAASLDTAVFAVPSALVPQERNYILNPAHRDFTHIVVGAPESFTFDPRMWK